MSELAKFVYNGAAQITPRVLNAVHKQLPLLKVEFANINAPSFPHLVDQLEFLANVVEDFADGEAEDLPYATLASAVFALLYAHRKLDLIPDFIPNFGRADDSAVVRFVLTEHQQVLSVHAQRLGVKWSSITLNP
jgi:uncharacterized membrane protein YkvA (DUF1232 family)